MDRYDVEYMIRDAVDPLRRQVQDLERDVAELRHELADERVARQDALESLERVVNSRTEHLA